MNKNKIIFSILWVITLILVSIVASNLAKGNDNDAGERKSGSFSIWILEDSVGSFSQYLDVFKELYPAYRNINISVESFEDSSTYNNALTSSVVSGKAPDIFMLSNSETSPFEDQTLAINPAVISPNEFRTNFATVFGEDLILTDSEDQTIEYLKWVPAWFEILGIFYNRKYFLRPSEMTTWGDIAKEVKTISEKYSNIIPVALGNGSWVSRAGDIIKTLFWLEWARSLTDISENQQKQVLAMYQEFGQRDGDNRYNILSAPFVRDTDIEFFTQWDTAAMIWYPRDIFTIDKIWYQKSFLFASPFPHYAWEQNDTPIKYNYFTINKDSRQVDLALAFLSFVASQQGQQAYVDTFPYYLSPELSVAANMSEKKILSNYNIVYKNFLADGVNLVSFNTWNGPIFEREVKNLLDIESWSNERFKKLKSFLICSSTKYSTLLNLSSSCK